MFIELVVQVVGKCQSVMHVPSFAVLLKPLVILCGNVLDFMLELFFSILDFCYGGADCDPLAYSVSQKSLCSLRVRLVCGRDRIG
ncbi:hypothetical protein ACOSQ4_031470 [Xanthoceras sorbifolium]